MTANPYDITQLALSHSSRALFHSCPRKLEFKKFYLRGARDQSFDADVGTCIHSGFQEFLRTGDEELGIYAMMVDYPYELFHTRTTNKGKSLEACYAVLNTMMSGYQTSDYELAKVHCLDGQVRPAIEVPFEIRILDFSLNGKFNENGTPEIPVIYTGFIDCVFWSRFFERFKAVDVKTHKNHVNDLTLKYKYDGQVLPYSFVLEAIQGRPVDTFDVEYLSCYIDIENPRVEPYVFSKSQQDVVDWMQGFYDDLIRIQRYFLQGWFPRIEKGDSCMAFNRPCEFADDCEFRNIEELKRGFLMGQQGVETLLTHRGEWNPWISIGVRFGE